VTEPAVLAVIDERTFLFLVHETGRALCSSAMAAVLLS
jgi:hypothetical protein